MMFLIQGQLDPLMQGQRKVNLKYQNSMGISGVSARHIYGVIGWFRIVFFNVTCSEEEVLDGSGAIVLSKLVLTSRASAASACSSLVFISASRVAAVSC